MAEIEEFEGEILDQVEYTDDGGAIVQIGEEDSERPNREWYDNIADDLDPGTLDELALRLLQDIDRDRQARKRRDKDYEEAIKRTGLGKETPGGADFEGASKAVHPMLTEATVDFASRAIKELMPPNGPVKMYVAGENPEPERFQRGERVKAYMNWQFLIQMKDFRPELEQLLTQLPLGGSQYLRIVWDAQKRRPVTTYWPIDDVYIPYSASGFYSAERVTFVEHITQFEVNQRVRSGMWKDLGVISPTSMPIKESDAQKATDPIEGKERVQPYNQDGLRDVFEVMCYCELEDEHEYAPYRITIDDAHRKIVAVNRNWEEDDDTKEPLYWTVEFPFVPWRGAYSIGLGQMIGSLSGAATGALRALLDSAHMNNLPTLLRLKGANFSGQSKELNVAQVTEIEGGIAGDDIRKLIMPVPFNPPSNVLMELLGFLTEAGRSVVQTTFEKLGDQNAEVPVGTTLALIEEGMTVFSAIHLRLFQAMDMVLRILARINRMYLDEEELRNDVGEVIAFRKDFDPPHDIMPVADPEIFSDIQRMAQLQVVADRAAQMPEVYNVKEVEKRILERTKIPNPDELLLPDDTPEEQNAVNENAAMSMGRPVAAFPEQDHLAHLQVHLDYLQSPLLGSFPPIAQKYIPLVLEHITEHMALYYVQYNLEMLQASTQMNDEELSALLRLRNREVRRELDKNLALQSPQVVPAVGGVLSGLPAVYQRAIELLQQFQPEEPAPPIDPNTMAAIEQEREEETMRDAREREETHLKLVDREKERQHEKEIKFMELDHQSKEEAFREASEDARKAAEYAARLEELMEKSAASLGETELEIESRERMNAEDNAAALAIAGVEAETKRQTSVKSGEGVTNPRPRTDT